MYTQDDFRRICSKFALYGDFLVAVPFGGGHVNDTFQLTFDQGGGAVALRPSKDQPECVP